MSLNRRIDVLAVASFGGHLEQLLQLRPAWEGKRNLVVTTRCDKRMAIGIERPAIVVDCHQGQWARALVTSLQLLWLMVKHRPRVLVTTGALPGLLAAIIANFLSIRVIWIDSVANAERLSTSGRYARRFADCHLTQWPHLADGRETSYAGSLF